MNIMNSVGLHHYLALSVLLFGTGLVGVLVRRNVLVVYMCLELMLSAVALVAVAFSRFNRTMDGAVFVFFIIAVAAAEVAVGLALVVALFRKRGSVFVDDFGTLKN